MDVVYAARVEMLRAPGIMQAQEWIIQYEAVAKNMDKVLLIGL